MKTLKQLACFLTWHRYRLIRDSGIQEEYARYWRDVSFVCTRCLRTFKHQRIGFSRSAGSLHYFNNRWM